MLWAKNLSNFGMEKSVKITADDAFVLLRVISEHLEQKVGSIVKAEY